MGRPRLLAFHVAMGVAYVVIISAWQAGWTRLSSVAVWAVALTVCHAGLLVCAALLAARGSGGAASVLGWLRHQFQRRRPRSAHRPPPAPRAEVSKSAKPRP